MSIFDELCRTSDLRDLVARVGTGTLVQGDLGWGILDGSWESGGNIGQLEGRVAVGRVAFRGHAKAICLCLK